MANLRRRTTSARSAVPSVVQIRQGLLIHQPTPHPARVAVPHAEDDARTHRRGITAEAAGRAGGHSRHKLPGFVLRVRRSGTHTYYATLDAEGARCGPGAAPRRVSARWHVLGTTAVLSAPEARDEARKVLADVARGDDPIAARQAEGRRITFATFVAEHYTPWATRNGSAGAEQAARLRAAVRADARRAAIGRDHRASRSNAGAPGG